jgi:hypothetical protein
VESFKYLGSFLANGGGCNCEIKSKIAMAKATFNNKRQNKITFCEIARTVKASEHTAMLLKPAS